MESFEFLSWGDMIFTFVFFMVLLIVIRFFVKKRSRS
ncbi:hypothetical protein DFR62_1826 [Planococcus citreus]|uniref:Uncharacterized protein n=1 Tax=Planococcus citreus TaxID=1373 RepID=A0A497YJ34_9BACL|nr:hypothetical protein DFR62_1826 [Planococcus citreus]